MLERFKENSVLIDAVYFCPHHPDGEGEYAINCDCRKPNPGMILTARDELGVDLAKSILVGDKVIDVKAGINAGIGRNFLIRTGHKINAEEEEIADAVLNSLDDLCQYIE